MEIGFVMNLIKYQKLTFARLPYVIHYRVYSTRALPHIIKKFATDRSRFLETSTGRI